MIQRSVVVIGNFDGVHAGHQELLGEAVRRAKLLADGADLLPVIVVTFWPHPLSVIAPKQAPQLLTTLAERIDQLRSAGAHEVRVVQFTKDFAAWSPAHFVDTIIRPLKPKLVCVGANFTFGYQAAGDVETLRELADDSFAIEILDLWSVGDHVSSSTLIREAVQAGDVETAARHLRRPFRVRGVVVMGDQRGHSLGFPTANLPVGAQMVTPSDGVYAGWVTQLGVPGAPHWPAAISVGTNPTFDGMQRRVESYVLDRDDLELYGAEIAVDFVTRLRNQLVFASVDELVKQMNLDVYQARQSLGGIA